MSLTLGELRRDFPLYARECLRIAPKKGNVIPFLLNGPQMKIEAAIARAVHDGRPPRIVVLKSRQVGVSTYAQGRIFHRCHLNPNRSGLVLAHKDDSARSLFRMSHRFYAHLPKAIRWKKRAQNRREIHFDTNDSRMQVEVEGEARGYTAQYVHLSEMAFYKTPEETLTSVLNTVPSQTDSLVVIESTPNGIGNLFHDLWVNAKVGKNDFQPVFIAWFDDPTCRMRTRLTPDDLTAEELAMVAAHGLDLQQVEWMRYTIANNCYGDMDKFRQEYPFDDRSCFMVSGRPVFEPSALQIVRGELEQKFGAGEAFMAAFDTTYPPCEIEWDAAAKAPKLVFGARGRLRIYEYPVGRRVYSSGWDPSAGDTGSDYSPGCGIDNLTLNTVWTWIGKMPPEELARVARLLGLLYNQGKVAWEANNHGIAFGITIEDLGYPNLYFRQTSKESVARAVTDKLGFLTTPKNRIYLFDNARTVVRGIGTGEFRCEIRDPWLLSQMEGMAFTRKNDRGEERAEPRSYRNDDPRFKDDLLLAYCLALEARKAYPEEPIRPLTLHERFEVLSHAKSQIAAGGDIHSGVVDRLNVTAAELEEIDEWAYKRSSSRARRGLGGLV